MEKSYHNSFNKLDGNAPISSYFEYALSIPIPTVEVNWFTDIYSLVFQHYNLIKKSFDQIKNEYISFIFGRPAPLWNTSNFTSLKYHLYFGHRQAFLSTSIMLYINPISQWRRCFIILQRIFSNRFAYVFFIGSTKMVNLSEIFRKINMASLDNFFHATDSWYGGFLSNIYNIYSMPTRVVNLKRFSDFQDGSKFQFYTKMFRRPSCIIALRYGDSAYHCDLECFKYRVPLIGLSDTDSKSSGFSKAMYLIPTTNYSQTMLSWHLLIFMYILRYLRYTRLSNELTLLNNHIYSGNIGQSIAEEDDRIALHTLAIDFKFLHKRTELVNIEKMSIKWKQHRKDNKIQNKNFYSIIRIFLEIMTVVTLALAIKNQGLVNFYYRKIFLFTHKKFTKILIIISYLFERFSKNKNYAMNYKRLISEKNIVFLNLFKKISDVTSRKAWLDTYLKNFEGSKTYLAGKRISLKKKVIKQKFIQAIKQLNVKKNIYKSFDFMFFRHVDIFKKFFYKKSNKLLKIIQKKYFRFQFRKKLKLIQIKQYKRLTGFVAPRQFVNTTIWKRLTTDQLMKKRSDSLFFKKKEYPKRHLFLKKNKKSLPVIAKKKQKIKLKNAKILSSQKNNFEKKKIVSSSKFTDKPFFRGSQNALSFSKKKN